MEKHTRLIAPYSTDQWGLSLSENGSANLCETVIMCQKPCQVITMLILNMQVKKKKLKKTTNLHFLNLIEFKQIPAGTQHMHCECHKSDLKRQASVNAETSSSSSSSIRDTISPHVSLKLLSRGQSLCASLFVALAVLS